MVFDDSVSFAEKQSRENSCEMSYLKRNTGIYLPASRLLSDDVLQASKLFISTPLLLHMNLKLVRLIGINVSILH